MIDEKKGGSAVLSLQENLKNLENGLKNLNQGGAKIIQVSAPIPNPPPPTQVNLSPSSSRQKQIKLIMEWVEKVSGIKADKRVYLKLEQLFKGKSDEHLEKLMSKISVWGKTHDADELLDVIEKLTVHETFFFREMEQLQPLQDTIIPQVIQDQRGLPFPHIRILSAPCSTGEEVYSLAILALQAFIKAGLAEIVANDIKIKPPWSLSITGIDISRRAIKTGQAAKYDCYNELAAFDCKNCQGQLCSFRSMPKEYFDFFTLHKSTQNGLEQAYAALKPATKRLVNFKVHNITKPLADNNFNIIICRNVLIYFDEEKKKQTQNILYKALDPGGILLLGNADSLLLKDKFLIKKEKRSVYFQKK